VGLLRALVPRPFLNLFASLIVVIAQKSTIVTIIIAQKEEKIFHEGGEKCYSSGTWALCGFTGKQM
jgi:hypothetical protein